MGALLDGLFWVTIVATQTLGLMGFASAMHDQRKE